LEELLVEMDIVWRWSFGVVMQRRMKERDQLDIGSSPRKDAGTNEKQDFSEQTQLLAEGEGSCAFLLYTLFM